MERRPRLLLASHSPRRRQLIEMLDVEFALAEVIDVDETYPESLSAGEVAAWISRRKADAYIDSLSGGDIIVTADTVVIVGDTILGKPVDEADAMRMLEMLSGRTHEVVTGVTLAASDGRTVTFSAVTTVDFDTLTPDEIKYYVEHYRPLDKAGAYGIQEWIGAVGIKGIGGSYYNVM